MTDFVHLHNHSDYSLLDGASPIDSLVDRAVELGMKHLALTDHGNMFGTLRFYKKCLSAGIKPIIGSELYVAPGSRLVKSGSENGNKYYHLVLLAKNETGYKNLIKLCSMGYTEGFYYKPRIDDDILAQYAEGLIASSACLAGEIPQLFLNGQAEAAEEKALFYRDLFGQDSFYLELQDHGIPEQKSVNRNLIALSRKTGIPLIATNDIHYVRKEDANAQDILLCIGTGRKKNEQNRMRFDSPEFFLKSGDEMARLFPEAPEAISNTVKVAEMCSLEIKLPGPILPEFNTPPEFDTLDDYMRHITYQGLKERYPAVTDEIRARADYELGVIFEMGFSGYFLIVWDYIHWAKKHGIPVGPGRGSGAGSIVAYAMTITDIDPLKYDLLFERFLNPERVSMPDFDIDFCFERRPEVIQYVTEAYGKDKVGQIITFGTLKAKAVIRDVARVLDIPYAEADQISKLIPNDLGMTLQKAMEMEPKLLEIRERGGIYQELIETALILEGQSRHASTHAAGVVIGRKPLTEYVPLYRDSKTGSISTQFTMDQLEECGLVKMDFLGLKTLTLIKNTEDLIRKRFADFDIETVSEEDQATFQMLGEGKSACVFQFESSGMQSILKQAKPNTIEDLIALNALYRPGPMQFIPQFIDSKMGRTPIRYPDPSLEEVLKPTYGVIVYQEQVMMVAQIIGGFSLGKADIMRRAMGKKKLKDMERLKKEFIAGAKEKGHSEKHAADIFHMLEPFAGYGFNKSHAAAYSVLAYKTAYLKANYPAEFMAANLTNEINNTDKMTAYISETREMGIEFLPPHINVSEKYFTVVQGRIVYGLMGIKNVGESAVEEILQVRDEGGQFETFVDFLDRVNLKSVNRKVIETLIQSGVFDNMGHGRATLMENLDDILEFVIKKKENEAFGQSSLFDAAEHKEFHTIEIRPVEEWPEKELLKLEKENLGFYFSGHPMDKYREVWEKGSQLDLSHPERVNDGKSYTVMGLIKTCREILTKKGRKMAFVQVEDYKGSIEVIFFSNEWDKYNHLIEEDAVLAIEGEADRSRGELKLKAKSVSDPETVRAAHDSELHIQLDTSLQDEDDFFNLRESLIGTHGNCFLFFHLKDEATGKEIIMKASNQIRVHADQDLVEEIKGQPSILDIWKE